jgi:hypothetical protein
MLITYFLNHFDDNLINARIVFQHGRSAGMQGIVIDGDV